MANTNLRTEPNVRVSSQAASTADLRTSSIDGIVVAAPLVVTSSDDSEVRLISNPKQFLNEYAPDGLNSSLHKSYHNIYSLLESTSVLVIPSNTDFTVSTTTRVNDNTNINRLSRVFGLDPFITYRSKIGISDDGVSYLLDNDNEIIDRYSLVDIGDVSIQSVKFLNLILSLLNNDFYVYGYVYKNEEGSVTDNLNLMIVYSSETIPSNSVNDDGVLLAGLLSGFGEITPVISETNMRSYQFIIINNNELGYTISNNNTEPLSFTIISKNVPNNQITVKVNYIVETFVEDGDDILKNVVINADGTTSDDDLMIKLNSTEIDINRVPDEFVGVLSVFDKMTGNVSPINSRIDAGTSPTVPNSINPDGENISQIKSTILGLIDADLGYRIDFIFDSGISDSSLHQTMNTVSKSIKSLACVTIDELSIGEGIDASVDNIGTFIDSTGVIDYNTYRATPMLLTNFGGYFARISPVVEYIKAIARNRNNNAEFAPVFNFTNGAVSVNSLSKYYGQSDRLCLLNSGINTVKFDRFRNVSYFNNNFTALPATSTSLFNEEQIVRMANRIGWDLDFILEQFLANLDIDTTAMRVKSIIETYMSTNILNQTYAPSQVNVVADATNNTYGDGDLLVEVFIYIGRALKAISVYNRYLPLSSLA